MTQGLPRRLRIAFVAQVVMASLVIVLGAYVAVVVAERELTKRTLQAEANHFWQRYEQDSSHRAPDNRMLRGHMVAMGGSAIAVPPRLRELDPGFHVLSEEDRLLLIDQRDAGRLYLSYPKQQVEWLMFWVVLGPVLLALLAILASSYYTYRLVKRLVAPVNWLAREVGHWEPLEPDISMLAPDRLPANAGIETRQLAGALHRMAERVRWFVVRERNFTRDASHELRTPLTVIRVASDLLHGDPDLPPRLQRSLVRIQRAGRDMEAVIDAFLILARESDASAHSENFQVRDVVLEEVEKAQSSTDCKREGVELAVVENGNPRLHAPPAVLSVMVGNLLRNACNFTDRGRIEVVIDDNKVTVRDSGVGMDAATLERVFDPFYRADFAVASGKGMGLTIVRRLGERFDWPVKLESVPGKGTIATISFGQQNHSID